MNEHKKYIIGICGKKRHGKTAFSLIMSTLFNLNNREVIVVNFADYLKQVADDIFNIKVGKFHKDLSPEERRILIDLGDAFREIDRACLVDYVEKKINNTKKNVSSDLLTFNKE